jgi:hypothetical protein
MKKLLLISFILLFSFEFFGQSPNEFSEQKLNHSSHYLGDASISAVVPNILLNSPDGSFIGGGLKL